MEKETFLDSAQRFSSSDEETIRSFDDLNEISETDLRHKHKRSARGTLKLLPWIAHLMFFTASLVIFWRANVLRNSFSDCLNSRRTWETTMGSVLDGNHFQRVVGSFNRSSSPYKGPPSPAVDAAWDTLTNYGAISITEETFQKINASKNAVKVPEAYGGGRQAFVESIHQLHCLRFLWMHTYPEYYTDAGEMIAKNDVYWHEHLDHCADMLRQKLMCDADVHLMTYNWLKGHEAPHPNFNTPRQCRNFEVVKQYALDHAIDGTNLSKGYFPKPKDGSVMEYDEPPFDPEDEGWPSWS